MIKKLLLAFVVLAVVGIGAVYLTIYNIRSNLPKMITLEDYKPILLTQAYDRKGKKIGEISPRERRILVPYDKIPQKVVEAFIAAEDDQFFQHKGVNLVAIMRAALANLRAGRNVQGGSTITQQVAKTMLLSSEKTYLRKIRELFLSYDMEEHLSKEDILYLYLNQIYFGASAHGIGMAAETYYRKPVDQLTLPEIAILAGLPKAPSEYSPIVNPTRAKERQIYVLNRMADVGFITKEEANAAANLHVTVYTRERYDEFAPYFLEAVRLLLVPRIGEDKLLNEGLSVHTSLDLDQQKAAQASAEAGLKALDKRQGYRGSMDNFTDPKAVGEFLLKTRNTMIQEVRPERIIQPDGRFADFGPLDFKFDVRTGLPAYMKAGQTYKGIVNKVDDENGLTYVKIAEVEGIIDFSTMTWARVPDPEKRHDLDTIKKPSVALKQGDVILVKVLGNQFDTTQFLKRLQAKATKNTKIAPPDLTRYIGLELDQEPVVETGLISFDQQTSDVLAMVGGYDFKRNKYNRALQAARQTGSAFKIIVYAAALDKGFTPATPILDAPLVYDETQAPQDDKDLAKAGDDDEEENKIWKPANHARDYAGDVIFRTAIVRSLNIPTVKITEDIGVSWVIDYAQRLGVFNKLNRDFTLGLGSSSVTLYEMTKMVSQLGRLGKRIRPVIIHKVVDQAGNEIHGKVTLDDWYEKQTTEIDQAFEERRQKYLEAKKDPNHKIDPKKTTDSHLLFEDPDQLMSPQTAYLTTSLLKAVVEDREGTGGRAKALNREVAGKTGTSNGYYDAWFVGFTHQVATGVWVGFNQEKSIGKGEVGGRAALPIWLEYMKAAHEDLPATNIPIPDGIVFANIDPDTGLLANTSSRSVIRQAFLEGTEPSGTRAKKEEETEFFKQDVE